MYYLGLVILVFILLLFYLRREHLGEWSSALVNLNNHGRMISNEKTNYAHGEEWGDALLNQKAKEGFQEKLVPPVSNVDSREAEFRKILSGRQ